jgi:hypothetical protein
MITRAREKATREQKHDRSQLTTDCLETQDK